MKHAVRKIRRSLGSRVLPAAIAVGFLAAGPGVHAQTASGGPSPAQLTRAGWDCFLPEPPLNPDFNRNVHCSPPGQLEAIFDGTASSGMFLAFDTDDVSAAEAELLGTERIIRVDLFGGQPCPTDPSPDNPPRYEYSSLLMLFGLDYLICHTFDSPW